MILIPVLSGASNSIVEDAIPPAADGLPNTSILVDIGPDGRLIYFPYNDEGDIIPDFSHAGYGGGGVPIPMAPVKVILNPDPDSKSDSARIQAALDEVGKLPLDENGLRGAVLLRRGTYRITHSLRIAESGVVLRGEGDGEDGTILKVDRRGINVVVTISGSAGPRECDSTPPTRIIDPYVPVGAYSFHVENPENFSPGQTVFIYRHGNEAWISEIGMDRIRPRPANPDQTRQWRPFDLIFDRVITSVDGDLITVDAPLVSSIDERWGGGTLVAYTDTGRIENCGVENLRAVAVFDPKITEQFRSRTIYTDEDQGNYLVFFRNVVNAWGRNLTTLHFVHGVAAATDGSKWITVQDCAALEPVSKITGMRRYPYKIKSGQILMLRCYAREARHAFFFDARITGPNVFLECVSEVDYSASEPHLRWSVGGLFDNVDSSIAIQDRQFLGTGHGWAGANYVVWNSRGSIICQKPPTAQNFAIGFIGEKLPGHFSPREDGWFESFGRHVEPQSLYRQQLVDRLGPEALKALEPAIWPQ